MIARLIPLKSRIRSIDNGKWYWVSIYGVAILFGFCLFHFAILGWTILLEYLYLSGDYHYGIWNNVHFELRVELAIFCLLSGFTIAHFLRTIKRRKRIRSMHRELYSHFRMLAVNLLFLLRWSSVWMLMLCLLGAWQDEEMQYYAVIIFALLIINAYLECFSFLTSRNLIYRRNARLGVLVFISLGGLLLSCYTPKSEELLFSKLDNDRYFRVIHYNYKLHQGSFKGQFWLGQVDIGRIAGSRNDSLFTFFNGELCQLDTLRIGNQQLSDATYYSAPIAFRLDSMVTYGQLFQVQRYFAEQGILRNLFLSERLEFGWFSRKELELKVFRSSKDTGFPQPPLPWIDSLHRNQWKMHFDKHGTLIDDQGKYHDSASLCRLMFASFDSTKSFSLIITHIDPNMKAYHWIEWMDIIRYYRRIYQEAKHMDDYNQRDGISIRILNATEMRNELKQAYFGSYPDSLTSYMP